MRLSAIASVVGAALALPLVVGFTAYKATSYTVKDPKGVNTIQFQVDGRIEQMVGQTTGISGDISFDPDKPEATTGKVIIDATSIQMANPTMSEHAQGEMWLNTAVHKEISFEIKEIKNLTKKEGKDPSWSADVTGNFTMLGKTKSITIPVTATYLAGQLATRNRMEGDLVVLRSQFSILRSDYGMTNMVGDVVADKIDIKFSVGAFAPKA